jgi:hypothetical protein
MAPCTMTVRNTCPFKVTFYALGGPVFCEIEPGETVRSEACAIWFSTRVQGPGTIFYSDEWESLKQSYINMAHNSQVEDGMVGSVLGWKAMELGEVFKLHNTKNPNSYGRPNIYFAAKMEGVYGNSNLLIYATLDPACKLTPDNPEKIWLLHLVRDYGQESPGVVAIDDEDLIPVYVEPDLTSYESSMFFRLMNKRWNKRIYASDDPGKLYMRNVDVAFDPIHFAEYWAILPAESAQTDLKIVNVKTNSWLTQFSSDPNKWIGLYSTGFRDEKDQHWKVAVTNEGNDNDPTTVKLTNLKTSHNLVSNDGNVLAGSTSSNNSDWIVETMCVNLENISDGRKFRIMEASTGKYLTAHDTKKYIQFESIRNDKQFFWLQRMPTEEHPDGFLLVNGYVTPDSPEYDYRPPQYGGNNGAPYRLSFNEYNNGQLLLNSTGSGSTTQYYPYDVWVFTVAGTRSGLRLIHPASGGILTHRNGNFTIEKDECKEQLFVIQLANYNGQESPGVDVDEKEDEIPVYAEPDLTSYESSMFFRLMSKSWNKRLYSSDVPSNISSDPGKLYMRNIDVPFDPIHFPEYWAIVPAESAQTDLKIMNVKTNKWLNQLSSDANKVMVVYNDGHDYQDQHWRVEVTGIGTNNDSTTVKLTNLKTNHNLVSSNGKSVSGSTSLYNSDWIVETMCVNLDNIPEGIKFRIMVASTGKYLTAHDNNDIVLESLGTDDKQYFYLQRMPTEEHPDDFLLVKDKTSNGDTYRLGFANGKLKIYEDPISLTDDVWVHVVTGTRSGLRLWNRKNSGFLTVKNDTFFTIESHECNEQLFVIQLMNYFTMCVNLDNIPDGLKFRIMVASTRKYLTAQDNNDIVLESLGTDDKQYFYLQRMPTEEHPDDFLLVKDKTSNGDTYRLGFANGKLKIYEDPSTLTDDVWVSCVAGTRDELRLYSRKNDGQLTVIDGVFTMQKDLCDEQFFVIQLVNYT